MGDKIYGVICRSDKSLEKINSKLYGKVKIIRAYLRKFYKIIYTYIIHKIDFIGLIGKPVPLILYIV